MFPHRYIQMPAWPLIMGVTMWAAEEANPPPPDPAQKVFQWMPVIFTFMLAGFPAGLVIYWSGTTAVGRSSNRDHRMVKGRGAKPELSTAQSARGGQAEEGVSGRVRPDLKRMSRSILRSGSSSRWDASGDPIRDAWRCLPKRYGRDKPGHDEPRGGSTPFTPDEIEAGRMLFAGRLGPCLVPRAHLPAAPHGGARGRLCRPFQCGKSSLVNALTGRNALARTSHTPGADAGADLLRRGGDRLTLVDMPGYGYAQARKPRPTGRTG